MVSRIEKMSTRIAKRIKQDECPYSVNQISHGIEIAMLYMLNAVSLLLASFLLGVLMEAVMIAALYILHRSFTGGFHLKNAWSCLIGGVSMILVFSLMIKHLPSFGAYTYFIVLTLFLLAYITNYRYAPAEHTYVSTDERIKRICRRIILFMLTIGCPLCELLIYFGEERVAVIYAFAVFLQSLHLHPISFRLAARLESTFGRGD